MTSRREGQTSNAAGSSELLAFDTPLGRCGVRWSEAGITRILLPGTPALETAPRECADEVPQPVRSAVAEIVALLNGAQADLRSVVLDDRDIEAFRRRVYAAAREIPPGATATYGDLARAIAEPDGARAVGAALAGNPFPIIVPCHRVLAASGALHGFSAPGGIATKRRLLEIERAPGFAQQSLFA